MAMTLGKLLTTLVMFIILTPLLGYLFSTYTTSNAQANYTNLASNTSSALRNSIFNPTRQLALNGANVTSNTTGSFFTNSFFYAFIFPNFGQFVYSIIQIPQLFGNIFQILFNSILGQAPGLPSVCPTGVAQGSATCTTLIALVASTLTGLIVMFIALLIVSMWMKYPAWA